MVGKRVIGAICRIRCTAEGCQRVPVAENPIISKGYVHRYQPVQARRRIRWLPCVWQAGRCVHDYDRKRRFLVDCARSKTVCCCIPGRSCGDFSRHHCRILRAAPPLYLISVKIARVRGLISIGDERALCAELQRLPECIEQTLKHQSDMQRIAAAVPQTRSACSSLTAGWTMPRRALGLRSS